MSSVDRRAGIGSLELIGEQVIATLIVVLAWTKNIDIQISFRI